VTKALIALDQNRHREARSGEAIHASAAACRRGLLRYARNDEGR
jgi:hypothetical protein